MDRIQREQKLDCFLQIEKSIRHVENKVLSEDEQTLLTEAKDTLKEAWRLYFGPLIRP